MIVDTGSTGLLVTEQYVNLANLGAPTATNLTQQYGLPGTGSTHTYTYNTYAEPVNFTNGIISAPTTIGVITADTVTTTTGGMTTTTIYTWNGTAYTSPTGTMQPIVSVMGIGLKPGGPLTSPVTALPGDLSQGVLLNNPAGAGELQFGANPLNSYASIPGTANNTLYVSITPQDGMLSGTTVSGSIDSGGVQGSVPSSLLATGATNVPVGDTIYVYTSDTSGGGTLLYSQTVNMPPPSSSTNTPPQSNFNSGVVLFSGDGGGLVDGNGAVAPDGIPIYVSYSLQTTYFD